jgi:hypothetical protein
MALAGTALAGLSCGLGVLAGLFPSGAERSLPLTGVFSILVLAAIIQFFAGFRLLSSFVENLEARRRPYGRKLITLCITIGFSYTPVLILLETAFTPGFNPSIRFPALWLLGALLPFAALHLLGLTFSGRGRSLVLRFGERIRILLWGRVR